MELQDSTYPLYPIASIMCSVALTLLLATQYIRQSWNIALLLLCVYLIVGNLCYGINTIVWARDWDVKLLVYCDISM